MTELLVQLLVRVLYAMIKIRCLSLNIMSTKAL